MITNILATGAALGLVASLSVMLYGWFVVSLERFERVTATDVLKRWDAQLAALPFAERERQRHEPPVEVLDAMMNLPSARARFFQLSYAR